MLGAIIEQVTGTPWHQAVVDRIARPLGLRTIRYALDAEGYRATARPYGEEDGRPVPARGVHISVAGAAGGLVGSARDLARWAQALHGGRVVTAALYREMTSPARLADGSTEPYGFGLRLRSVRGHRAFVHGGSGRGIDTDSLYIPDQQLFVAVLANSDRAQTDPAILSQRLAALALGQPIPTFTRARVDRATIEPLLGSYTPDRGTPLRFFARGERLFLGRGEEELEAFAAGEDRFFFGPGRLMSLRFVRAADGATRMEVDSPEAAVPQVATRTGAAPPPLAVPPAVLATYVGRYQTEGPLIVVALDAQGGLVAGPPGQTPAPLRPTSATEFRIEDSPMRVVFHPENGRVDRLTLFRGARELHGQRTAQ